MTKALQKVIDRLTGLPDEDQDKIAALIMEELHSDQIWEYKFTSSQDALSALSKEAQYEYKSGKTRPISIKK